jgi:hypothetical protein
LILATACAVGATDPGAGTDTPPPDDGDAGSAAPPSGALAGDAATPSPAADASHPTAADAAPTDAEAPKTAPDAQSAQCNGYATPTKTALCTGCGTSHPCEANGCYNGYYCELAQLKCVPKPASCP